MAAKVNTKFVAILSLTLFTGVASVGGVLWWVLKNDATRLIRKGDEAVAAGELKVAERLYAKAVNKRQTDGPLLKKWGDILQQITPDTQTEYNQRYGEFVNMLRSYAVLQSTDVGAHRTYLDLIYKEVVFSGYKRESYDRLIESTDRALSYFDKGIAATNGNPDTLKRFRGIARSTILAQLSDQVDPKAADEALADLTAAIKADPTDEASLNGIVIVQSARSITFRKNQLDNEAAAAVEKAREAITGFLTNRPDSPSVQLSSLELDLDEATRAAILNKIGAAIMAAAKEKRVDFIPRLDPIADSLKKLGPSGVEPLTMARFMVAETLIDPTSKRKRTHDVLQDFITRQPDNFFAMQLQADLLAESGKHDEAIALLQKIVDLPKRKLGVDGLLLQGLQPAVVGKQARFCMLAWERAKPEDRVAALTKAKDFAAKFRTVAGDVPQAMLLDAQIKFGEGDLPGAQKLLLAYNTATNDSDADGLWLLAQVMKRNNSSGSTERLIEKVIKLQPGNTQAYTDLASVKIQLQKFDDAVDLLDRVLQMDPDNAIAKQLKQGIDASRGLDPVIDNDPVRQAISTAQKLVLTEKNALAIDLLRKAFVANNYNPNIAQFLAQQLNGVNDKAGALAVIEEAIAHNPAAAKQLGGLKIVLEISDPLEAELALIATLDIKPLDKILMRATSFRKYGKKAESDQELADAVKLDPEDPRLIELLFLQALERKDLPTCAVLVDKAEKRDLDRVGGRTFHARYLFAQGQFAEAISLMQTAAAEFALTPDTWRVLARMQVEAGRGGDALVSYGKALEMRPDDITLIIEEMALLQSMNRNEDALQFGRTNLKYGQGNPVFANLMLDLEGQSGDKAKALEMREKKFKDNPKDFNNRLAIAWLNLDLQQFDKARKAIDELRKEKPQVIETLVLDARYYSDRGDFNTARNLFTMYLAEIPRESLTTEPYIAFSRLMFQYEQNEGAITALEQARRYQNPTNMEVDRLIADHSTRLRRPAHAEVAYRRIIAGKADTADQTYTRRLIENLNAQKKYTEAQQFLATLVSPVEKEVVTLLLAADTARGLNDDKKAQDLLDRAKTAFPNDARVWVKSAQANMRRPELATDAEADLNRALQIEPRNAQLYEIRGGYYISAGKPNEGIADLQRAVSLNPSLAELRLTLMRELIHRDRAAEALSLGEEALKARGNDVQLALDMADVFFEARQSSFAARFYKAAWDLNKTPTLTQRYLDALMSAEPPMLTDAEKVLKDAGTDVERSLELRLGRARLHWRRGRMEDARRDLKGCLDLVPVEQTPAMMLWFNETSRIYAGKADRARQLDQFERESASPQAKGWLTLFRGMTMAEDPVTRSQGLVVIKQIADTSTLKNLKLLAYQQLAIGHYMAGGYAESVDVLTNAVTQFPDDWELNNNLAYTMAFHLNRAKDALPYAEKSTAIRPTNVDSLDTLGTVHLMLGDLPKAEQFLRQAISSGGRVTGQTSAMIHLCKVMIAKKDFTNARKMFDELDKYSKSATLEMPAEQKKELDTLRTELDSPQSR